MFIVSSYLNLKNSLLHIPCVKRTQNARKTYLRCFSSWTSAELQQMTRASQENQPKCFMATLSVGRLNDVVSCEEPGASWGIVIWAGCLFEYSPVTYTLSVTSNASKYTATYTGELKGGTDDFGKLLFILIVNYLFHRFHPKCEHY